MNTKKVISYLHTSDTIGGNEMVDISALKKEYPWFSALYQLEAKCLKNDNKFGLKKSIKTASLYAGNREVLYDFMHDSISFGSSSIVQINPGTDIEKTIDKKPVKRPTIEPKPNPTPKISTPTPKPIVAEEKEKETKKVVDDTKLAPEVIKQDKIEKALQEEQKPTITYDPLVELQSKIVKEEEPQPKRTTKAYDPLVELPKLEKKQPPQKRNKQDFFSWLDDLEDDQPKEEPKPRKLKMSAEASQLLENFIKNRPSISRIRTDIDRTEIHKIDRENTEDEMVTESLAELHVKQGRPENAIDIYEKLRLQNPQKFSYFAALIEKIKKDNNLE
ncbi:MAG: hypothetical protein KC517_03175 [Bacteroidetes bacterium]|nr:hypothetical protein [Bacteroidota bacterium]